MLTMVSGNVFNLQDFEKMKLNSNKEAVKIPSLHFSAYLMQIHCQYERIIFSIISALITHLAILPIIS